MKKSLLLFCFILIALGSCKGKKETTATPDEVYSNLQSLKIGAMSSMDYIPFVVAKKEGIYDSLGLDVTIFKFFSANDRDAAFQSGNIDGTVIDYTGAALQQANGIPLNLVMETDGFFYLITGKNSGIDTIEQLKGKNIAVSRNSVIEYTADQILARAGIPINEVNKPEINKIPLRLEMLQNGQVDASIFPDPFATIAMKNGNKTLITTQDMGISVTGTIFSQKTLKEKRKEIEVLIKGYNLAVKYINEHPLSEWGMILVENAGISGDMINNLVLPKYKEATLPSPQDIEKAIVWLKEKKLIPDTYQGEHLVDTIKGVNLRK